MIEFEEEKQQERIATATIKVIGVGGAGGNTVNSIIESGYKGIDFIVANTDAQALMLSKAETKIQIGVKSTKGLGTGANPGLGKRAAEENLDKILESIGSADIVFLAGGMGGGTGSGALPVIAHALKEKNILSIAIVTKPFLFEGKRRAAVAEAAIESLRKEVDTLLIVPNQKLLDLVDKHVSMIDAFAMINDLLCQSIKGVSDIITKPGHMNVDFSDVRAIMKDMGLAVMGTGCASGDNRAKTAALQAISSPLLENMSVKGARGVLFNITGGTNLSLHEIGQAASVIYEQAHEDANIILGSVIDEAMQDEVSVTIVATGFSPALSNEKSCVAECEKLPEIRECEQLPTFDTFSPDVCLDSVPKIGLQEKISAGSEVTNATKEHILQDHQVFQDKKQEMLNCAPNLTEDNSIKAAQVIDSPVAQAVSVQKISMQEAENLNAPACKEDEQAYAAAGIDVDDLDVPAFLRKEKQQGK